MNSKLITIFSIIFSFAFCSISYSDHHMNHGTKEEDSKIEKNTEFITANGKVFFKNIKNGIKVKSPFKAEFGVKKVTIEPAGTIKRNTGHHHLIINGKSIAEGMPVPANDTHIHFGKGQTETEVTLKPGKYTLTLQFADGMHRSYGKKLSKTINIEVE